MKPEATAASETFARAEQGKAPVPPPPHVGPGRGKKNAGYRVTTVSKRGNRSTYLAGRIKAKVAKGDAAAVAVALDCTDRARRFGGSLRGCELRCE